MDAIAEAATELKRKRLMGERVEVVVKDVSATRMLSIYADLSKQKIICSRDLEKLDRYDLEVCLLHENAHILLYPRFRIWLFSTIAIQTVAFGMLLGRLMSGDLVLALVLFAVLLLGRYFLCVASRRYERAADYHALKSLKTEYGVEHPSEMLKSAISAVRSLKGPRRPKAAYLLKTLGYCHPGDSERVSRIASTLDEPG